MSFDAMKQALEALEEIADEVFSPYDNKLGDAILALRAAIKEAQGDGVCRHCSGAGCVACDARHLPEQEPVAWMHNLIEGNVITHRPADIDRHPERWAALYTAPPPCPTCEALARSVMMDQTSHDIAPRQWQGLTEQEIKDCEKQAMVNGALPFEQRSFFARAIEATLREKNNG